MCCSVARLQEHVYLCILTKRIFKAFVYMGVSKNSGTPKSSILIGFSIIFTIHFGVPLFSETPIWRFYIFCCSFWRSFLPEKLGTLIATPRIFIPSLKRNIFALKINGWKMNFPFGGGNFGLFSGANN